MRSAAAARQPGTEMNETDGMSTSEGISQDNSVLNCYFDLSVIVLYLLIQVWQSYQLKQGYASLDILSQPILGYPNLKMGLGYPRISLLAQRSFFQMFDKCKGSRTFKDGQQDFLASKWFECRVGFDR